MEWHCESCLYKAAKFGAAVFIIWSKTSYFSVGSRTSYLWSLDCEYRDEYLISHAQRLCKYTRLEEKMQFES
jgi:hypothetical protein